MTTDNRASEHDSTTNPALAVHVSQLVKRYGDMAGYVAERVETYAAEVRARTFPTADQTYAPKP